MELHNNRQARNGSAFQAKQKDAVEFPNDNDQRKLSQLFDTFKIQKKEDKSAKKRAVATKRISTKRYSDSESDSSSTDLERDKEDETKLAHPSVSAHRGNVSDAVSDFEQISAEESVQMTNKQSSKSKESLSSNKTLRRNHSDDSDQTLLSDDTPFSKSSTETQIKVEIHSDSSSTSSTAGRRTSKSLSPELSKSNSASRDTIDGQFKPKKNFKQSATEVVMAMKMSPRSNISQRSASSDTSNSSHPPLSRQQNDMKIQGQRSYSPYSFDSLPSSHANSPLPKKRMAEVMSEYSASKDSSDTDSVSRMSGYDNSGTESQTRENSSGTEDFVVEELSKVCFRRVSHKKPASKSSKSNFLL